MRRPARRRRPLRVAAMPGKQDVSLPNRHHVVVGASGSGKSSWLRSLPELAKARRFIAWDPDQDHKCHHCTSRAEFARTLKGAVASGKPFRVGLCIDPTPANFEFFCRCVWAIASADALVHCVVEELADVTTSGKASATWGQMIRRGRKYGLVLYAVTQRPAEIDKTTYSQCVNRWCGRLDNEIDAKRMAQLLNVPPQRVSELEPLQFLYRGPMDRQPIEGKVKIPRRRK